MTKRYATRRNADGNYEYGYSDESGKWTVISVHESSPEAQDALKEGIQARLARLRRGNKPPAPLPPLVRLETGDWVDPTQVDGVRIDPCHLAIEINMKCGRCMQVTSALFDDDVTNDMNRHRTRLAATIAAQINAARLGGSTGQGEDK